MGDTTPEHWLPVPGYEGYYEVSDLGRVRSVFRITSRGHHLQGRVLKERPLPSGYVQACLSREEIVTYFGVHRLVTAAFIGPCPEGMEVMHEDDNRANNRLSNLSYGTHLENQRQMSERGRTRKPGTHCGRGHAMDEANLYIAPNGTRTCRICKNIARRMLAEARRQPVMLVCAWCQEPFERPLGHSRRKYCTPECSYGASLENARKASRRNWKLKKEMRSRATSNTR